MFPMPFLFFLIPLDRIKLRENVFRKEKNGF